MGNERTNTVMQSLASYTQKSSSFGVIETNLDEVKKVG